MLRRPTAELTANTGVKTQEKRQVSKQTEIVLYWSVLTPSSFYILKAKWKKSIIKYRSVLYQSNFSTISCNQSFTPVENKSGQFLVRYVSNLIHRDYTNFWEYDTAFTESCGWFSIDIGYQYAELIICQFLCCDWLIRQNMRTGIFNGLSLNAVRKDREISMQRQYYYNKSVFEFHALNILLLTPGLSSITISVCLITAEPTCPHAYNVKFFNYVGLSRHEV